MCFCFSLVGEEIEMTPLLFSKGLADCGSWGEKYFGRIMKKLKDVGASTDRTNFYV